MYENCPVIYFKINMMDDGESYDNKFVYTKELNVQSYGFAEKRRHVEFSRNGDPLSLLYYNKNIYNFKCLQSQEADNDDSQIGDNN